MCRAALFILVLFAVAWQPDPVAQADDSLPLDRLRLPAGYGATVYARIPGARSLADAPELNAVFVGSRGATVHAIVDADRDGRADRVIRVLDGLKVANGIAWKAPFLYVAEQHRIVRYKGVNLSEVAAAQPEVLYDGLPDAPWHGWRYAAFGPDGWLYVAVGAPCNICTPVGLEGTIVRLDPAGDREPVIFAEGIRNSVGLGFHPVTGDLFFTDNGADHMGDDSPPDEFNRATGPGGHYGYPFYGGGGDRTRQFRDSPPPAGVIPPSVRFGAHVAALGFAFLNGDAIVAQHGSWNRSVPDGYRLARVPFGDGKTPIDRWEPFIEGWLDSATGDAWGRPVDVLSRPGGVLLVSDDAAGVIYRFAPH